MHTNICIVTAKHKAISSCVRPWFNRQVTSWLIYKCSSDITTQNDSNVFGETGFCYLEIMGKLSFIISRSWENYIVIYWVRSLLYNSSTDTKLDWANRPRKPSKSSNDENIASMIAHHIYKYKCVQFTVSCYY